MIVERERERESYEPNKPRTPGATTFSQAKTALHLSITACLAYAPGAAPTLNQ